MQLKEFNFELDIEKQINKVKDITIVSQDHDTNRFTITLLENYEPYNLENTIVRLITKKSDNTTVQENGTIIDAENGIIEVILNQNTFSVVGKCLSEIQVFNSADQTKRLTSTRFEWDVIKSLFDENTVKSTNEYSELQDLVKSASDIKNITDKVTNLEQQIQNIDVTSQLQPIKTDVEGLKTTTRSNHDKISILEEANNSQSADLTKLGKEVATHQAETVKKAGDTMTGSLTVPRLNINDYNVRTSFEKTMPVEADLTEFTIEFPAINANGTVEITLTTTYTYINAIGSLTKRIDFYVEGQKMYNQNSKYTFVNDNTTKHFMISDLYYENEKWKIKILQKNNGRNTARMSLNFVGSLELKQWVENMMITDCVVSTDTFVEPKGSGIHSSGSNANGEWIRFEDGTQICTRIIDYDFSILEFKDFIFPASFIAAPPSASWCLYKDTLGANSEFINGISTITLRTRETQWNIRHWNSIYSGIYRIGLTAIGRWK